jgi:MFS family permease
MIGRLRSALGGGRIAPVTAAPRIGPRRAGFTFVLFAAMGAATFPAASLGIVATFIIDDFGIERADLGLAVAANTLLSALLSPVAGRITDAVGGKLAAIGVFGLSAAAFAVFGVSVAFWVLFVGSFIAAWSQAGGNPATNKLIAEALPMGERGIVTGIKQSGVQAAIFLGGLTLPSLAIALGWRSAFLLVAVVSGLLAVATAWLVPRTEHDGQPRPRATGSLPESIRWLAGYGFLLGFAGAVTFLVPLFAEEALGFDPRLAGVAASVVGFTAFVARIGWARRAEVRDEYRTPLLWMALLSVLSATMMALAPDVGAWLLWLGVIVIGSSSAAWNSVGMLAVMNATGSAATGRASGVVLLGFLAGLGLGPPIYGAIVDRYGYRPMWLLSVTVAALATVLVLVWQARSRAVGD